MTPLLFYNTFYSKLGAMQRSLPILGLLFMFAAVQSCAPLSEPLDPLPTNMPAPTATLTPTVDWFPSTPTHTPLPTVTVGPISTAEVQPQFGSIILSDDFSQAEFWTLGSLPAGNMALGVSELTLAVSQERGYLFSQRLGIELSDYYLEITASPSICRGEDEYGVLIRISQSLDFFRFGLSCSGYARLDRFYQGQASSPQPPIMSGSVPPGAPSSSRLSILAKGKEMVFYANGERLFSVSDGSLLSGGVGLFVRASGPDIVTVNFSDLVIYETVD